MYQIKYGGGYEIQVLSAEGKAKMGYEARVELDTSSSSVTQITGTMEECEAWLKKNGIKPHGATHADSAAARGRSV
jgi:hypothetical protein